AERLSRAAAGGKRPLAIVSSGETTVHVRGKGRGGRNQEFALALAQPIATAGGAIAGMSLGRDGGDGPTDAAGPVVDATALARGRDAGLSPPSTFLDNNNSYAFFDAIGDLIHTGPTGTNVGDVQVALIA